MQKSKTTKPHIQYTTDELGNEVLLKDGNLQVMMEWEKPYMEACIDALKPSGDVLEIGFGLGYSATRIQKFRPKSHTIIECEPVVIKKAKEWAKSYPNIKIVEGFWQDQLAKLGVFDAIFFDDYTPLSPEEAGTIEEDARACQKQQKDVKKTIDSLKAAFHSMKGVKFTDDQVADFIKYLHGRKEEVSLEMALDFVQTLVEQGNMTIRQELSFPDNYKKLDKAAGARVKGSREGEQMSGTPATGDRLLNFYQLCLDSHMRKGSRMSSYIDLKQFRKNYSQFETLIASRPDVVIKQQVIPVEVSANCTYYTGSEAIVLTIGKK